jgi:hypothetical protein
MWIIDLEQMLDQAVAKPELPDLKEKVKELGYLVTYATSIESGISTDSKPMCWRQPSNHPCNGILKIRLLSTKKQVCWKCPKCGDDGVIIGWKGLIWDKTVFLNPKAF